MSLVAVIAAAAIFVLPSILANSALATQNFGSPFGALFLMFNTSSIV
jgi:hypothetical protein